MRFNLQAAISLLQPHQNALDWSCTLCVCVYMWEFVELHALRESMLNSNKIYLNVFNPVDINANDQKSNMFEDNIFSYHNCYRIKFVYGFFVHALRKTFYL